MEISYIFSTVTASVAIIGVFLKREEILALRNKDYTAKLDSTIRFFNEFYGNKSERKLVLDRAAQEVVRLDIVDYKIVEYLIILDEYYLINIDEILKYYRNGKKFIEYTSSSEKISFNNFKLKLKKGCSLKKQKMLYTIQYFICASLISLPFVFSSWFYHLLIDKNTPVIITIFTVIYWVFGLIATLIALTEGGDLNYAEKFIENFKNASNKYNSLMLEKKSEGILMKLWSRLI